MSAARQLARTRYLGKSARRDFVDRTAVAAIEQAVAELNAACIAVYRGERMERSG